MPRLPPCRHPRPAPGAPGTPRDAAVSAPGRLRFFVKASIIASGSTSHQNQSAGRPARCVCGTAVPHPRAPPDRAARRIHAAPMHGARTPRPHRCACRHAAPASHCAPRAYITPVRRVSTGGVSTGGVYLDARGARHGPASVRACIHAGSDAAVRRAHPIPHHQARTVRGRISPQARTGAHATRARPTPPGVGCAYPAPGARTAERDGAPRRPPVASLAGAGCAIRRAGPGRTECVVVGHAFTTPP